MEKHIVQLVNEGSSASAISMASAALRHHLTRVGMGRIVEDSRFRMLVKGARNLTRSQTVRRESNALSKGHILDIMGLAIESGKFVQLRVAAAAALAFVGT